MPGFISIAYELLPASELAWVLPDLKDARLRATFFGDSAHFVNHIAAWKSAIAEGHDLGNAAWLSSKDLYSQMSPEAIEEDLGDLDALIREVSGTSGFIPRAKVMDGNLWSVEGASGTSYPVESLDELRIWESLRDSIKYADPGVVLSFRVPDPRLHQMVLEWLANRLELVHRISEL